MENNHFYSSRHVATIFGVSLETVRNWADEFQDFLSPTARPGKGKHRMYSYDDLRVFSLVSELKGQGMTYADIQATLHAGQRGQPPSMQPGEIQALVVGEQETRLSLEVEYLQRSLMKLQQQLAGAQEDLEKAQAIKEENIKLGTQLEEERKRVEEKETQISELKQQLSQAQTRIEQLIKETGEAYAKGLIEALERKGDLPKVSQ